MSEHRDYYPRNPDASEPAIGGDTWPCGHPRTPANTQSVGHTGVRCRICRRKINRESQRRRAAAKP